MREFHPVTDCNNPEIREKRVILGSFPTHRFTRKSESEKISDSKGYFYGGERNQFWLWYAQFVDQTASKESVETLRRSLEEHEIGITDIIYSCERSGNSAADNDLKNRVYNYGFLKPPAENELLKILCTSKGVMNNMLLSPAFFTKFTSLELDENLGKKLEERILKNLESSEITIPLCRVLKTSDSSKIEIVALPSPGSPFRSLKNFGYQKGDDAKAFLEIYLGNAFRWFKSDVNEFP